MLPGQRGTVTTVSLCAVTPACDTHHQLTWNAASTSLLIMQEVNWGTLFWHQGVSKYIPHLENKKMGNDIRRVGAA